MAQVDGGVLSAAKRALLEQRLRGPAATSAWNSPVTRLVGHGPAPLSPEQEQIWYPSQLAVYNEVVTVRKDGPFDADAFRRAFNEVVRRHEVWRSTFPIVDGEPVQIVHAAPVYKLPLVDLSDMPREEAETDAARRAAEASRRPYALDRGPLLRAFLVRFGADHHRLYLALPHLIFDGVTLYRVVLPELIALYDAFAAGRPSPLPDPTVQFGDYAEWKRKWVESPEFSRRLDHWRDRFHDASVLRLPLDHPRAARQRFRGGMEEIVIEEALATQLRTLSRQTGATLFQVLAAAFAVLLHRYSGQDDIVFATMADQRQRAELESMVGYCLTPVVLRADLKGDPTFKELLGHLRAEVLEALDNQVPFERLLRALHIPRDPAVSAIYQAMIVIEPPMVAPDPSWSLHQMDVEIGNLVGHAKLDLHIELDQRPDGHISGRLIYNSDLFERETARRIAGHWHRLLEAIAVDPSRRISDLPLLTEGERRQLIDWNATDTEYPRRTSVHEIVSAQARRTPEAVAVITDNDHLTFGQIDRRANALAHRLRAAGARPGSVVGICVERSSDMVIGLLAILKSGAAYLPLDPSHPTARLTYMLEDSGAEVLLIQPHLLASRAGNRARVVSLDGTEAEEQAEPPEATVSGDDIAYVMYTSGSTGKPKGVQVRHQGVVNLLTAMAREPGMGPTDTILAITTFSFDISVLELLLPLMTGARTVIAASEVAAEGRRLGRLVTESGATFMQATPTTWQMLRDTGWSGNPDLRVVTGGETLTPPLAEWLTDRTARVWNAYGPTETTVWSTLARIKPGGQVTVGRPIANTAVHILDRQQQPVPVGVTGQIFIGGDGVARGYLNRAELTAERFVPDPFTPGACMYATGDLGRRLADGRIEHLGRLDDQVKVRGYRIEPGEIEAALGSHPQVGAAAVVVREYAAGDARLIAYVVPKGTAPSPSELRTALRSALPDHMVPSAFVVLDALPLTSNGKIDRGALPAPQPGSGVGEAETRAPRTALERRVATIWARTMGVAQVGVDDDFFESGGHSLLAVRLLSEVQRHLGVDIPLAAFFKGGVTVADLAGIIEASQTPVAGGGAVTVPIQSHGSGPILFFVHVDESSMLTLRHFAGPLGPEQRVLGLLPERVGRRFDRTRSLEELAEPMLATIRKAQPHGPYLIAGYSLGGLFAYELAGKLLAAGEAVAWLGLLDAGSPAASARYSRHRLSLTQRLARQRLRGPGGALRKTDEVMRRELRALMVRLRGPQTMLADDFDWRGANRLAISYACKGNDAPMDVFVTDDRVTGSGSRSLGWDELHRGPLRVHRLDGDHRTIVTEPQVRTLAELVTSSLRDAQRAAEAK